MLVSRDLQLKICDFGMAKDVSYHEYYRRISPVGSKNLSLIKLILMFEECVYIGYSSFEVDSSRSCCRQVVHRIQ